MKDIPQDDGTTVSLATLVQCRPDRRTTGFAPGGKVRTHQFGTKRSIFRGRGMEFDEARIYQPGDDVRAIDWRLTARTGELHTKLFHEERERPVLILADLRAAMQFGTRVRFKSVLAATIAAELAWVGIDGGDRVGGFLLRPGGSDSFPATRNTAAILRFLKALSAATQPAAAQEEPPLHTAIDRLRHVSRPGTLVFLISDFADYDERTERAIKRLSMHAHVSNLLIYDQLDAMLPHGAQRISDGEAVTLLSALPRAAIEAHASAFEARKARIETLSRQRGMAFLALPTSAPPGAALSPHRRKARGRSAA
ncbi:DUF58 domain-containing protein [Tropicimonas sp. IMCC34043]|uniref:DUF58 domain-containing protein n=1 Tax=Tropicimonas sp. IMCC34043 TaxID=2248760 RepID=UPI000E23E2BA|nr:DUF58 domain-containing protein [Tropicimonas sp. IMCC34043]